MVIKTYTCILILAPHISSESSLDFFSEPRDEALHSLTILVLERDAGVQGRNYINIWCVAGRYYPLAGVVWCHRHTARSDTRAGCPFQKARPLGKLFVEAKQNKTRLLEGDMSHQNLRGKESRKKSSKHSKITIVLYKRIYKVLLR